MRTWALCLLFLAACATTSQPRPDTLPCTDEDAPRCLAFVNLLNEAKSRDGVIAQGLERHCLAGSLASCQQLAKLRNDFSLQALCRDGVVEACPLPEKANAAALEADCVKRLPGACRKFGAFRYDLDAEPKMPGVETLEAGCAEGLAGFCFSLAGAVSATAPERARTLKLRACLAGHQEACRDSDEIAASCIRGAAGACRSFMLNDRDEPAQHTRKVGVLKKACQAGADGTCRELITEKSISQAELLTLSCGKLRECASVVAALEKDALVPLCDTGTGLARDLACTGLLENIERRGAETIPEGASRWARAHCPAVPKTDDEKEDCQLWGEALWKSGLFIESTRVRCRVPNCDDQQAVQALDACLANGKGDDCARASAWLDRGPARDMPEGSEDLRVSLEVMKRACDAKELTGCTAASRLLSHDAVTRLSFERKACALGSKPACDEQRSMELAQKRCTAGHCEQWARYFEGHRGKPAGLALLEKTCGAGEAKDCEAWRYSVSKVTLLSTCARGGKGFCPPGDQQRIAGAWAGCEKGVGAQCELLMDMAMDYGRPSEATASSPEFIGWGRRGCDAGSGTACLNLASALPGDEERLATFERACTLDSAEACHVLAMHWFRELSPQVKGEAARTHPTLIKARALATKACALNFTHGCETAADFWESGIGGAVDPLEAARFNQRASDSRH